MTDKGLKKARQEVERYLAAEREFSAKLATKSAQLGRDLAENAGADVLAAYLEGDGDRASLRASGRIARLRAEVDSLASAVNAARRARRAAIPSAWQAEAELLRAQAAQKRAEAARIDAEAAPHLEALRAVYGVAFVPLSRIGEYTAVVAGVPPALRLPPDSLPGRLLQEAADLEARAGALSARRLERRGSAAGEGLDGLLAAVFADPFRMAPTQVEVLTWAEAAASAEHARWLRERRSDHLDTSVWEALRLRYTLLWVDERVIPDECRVEVPPVRDRQGAAVWSAVAGEHHPR